MLLGSVIAVAVLAWFVLRRATQVEMSWLLAPFLACCLAMSTGVDLGLDRGQADAFLALLTWAAIVLYLRGSLAPALFLLVWATSMKGYSFFLLAGICLLEVHTARFWKRGIFGALAAMLLFFVPVLPYVADGFRATLSRATMFGNAWYNHSFMSAVNWFSPENAITGHKILTVFALVGVVVTWINLRMVRSRGAEGQPFTLAFLVFATAALGAMLGLSRLSVSYNLIIVLPGAIVLAGAQQALAGEHLAQPHLAAPAGHLDGAVSVHAVRP